MLESLVTPIAIAAAIILVILLGLYLRNRRWMPWNSYQAGPAWIRGGIYFCICWLLSYFSGGLKLILTSPLATSDNLNNTSWVGFTALCVGFVFMAYSVLWVRYTVRFNRPNKPLMSTLFGLLWGSSSGQLFLATWLFATKAVANIDASWVNKPVLAGVIAWSLMGIWQPNFHNVYWDHYIAPEHDTALTQKIKALGCHVPNLAITLLYLGLFHNYAIFVGFQVIACISAATGMHFPAPWAKSSELDYAHRTVGTKVPRCTGYVSDDYTTDPYTPFHPGWTGPQKTPV
ncbi:MAG: hypothetical protein WCL12_04610 [Actinomycetes bacterium]|jgi:hypothetical protein